MKKRYFVCGSIVRKTLALWIAAFLCMPMYGERQVVDVASFSVRPDTGEDMSPVMEEMLQALRRRNVEGGVVLRFSPGRYDFYPENAAEREYYISNHDQDNPKRVGIALEDWRNLTLDGNGARFVFHGRMLPVSLLRSENCTLKNFSVDFENPHIAQVEIVDNAPAGGIAFRPAPWVHWRITPDSIFEAFGKDWVVRHGWGVVFEKDTKRLAYNTGDRGCTTRGAYEESPGVIRAPQWKDDALEPGMWFVMRGWGRPAPGIFLSENTDTRIENVRVHYAEGMGLLAQLCENVTLDCFGVCLKGEDDPRCFTTQADATHFSGCKGRIVSCDGLYEGMMDDAINIHGTYLKVLRRMDDYTLVGRYMHGQSWGFKWGEPGDTVQFVCSRTMETVGGAKIVSIRPYDKEQVLGAREFLITFRERVDSSVTGEEGFGIENLTWTPEVVFARNTIRNNRARGALFSSPKRTVVEDNVFDHTSGTAILLCGDCNGWYETGACRDVVIRRNRFINALTSLYQFTNGIISIYPEIPELHNQRQYFHGGKKGIVIEENEFDNYGVPVLYAKSVDGLIFRRNVIRTNTDYRPFHPIRDRFRLERVTNVRLSE